MVPPFFRSKYFPLCQHMHWRSSLTAEQTDLTYKSVSFSPRPSSAARLSSFHQPEPLCTFDTPTLLFIEIYHYSNNILINSIVSEYRCQFFFTVFPLLLLKRRLTDFLVALLVRISSLNDVLHASSFSSYALAWFAFFQLSRHIYNGRTHHFFLQ